MFLTVSCADKITWQLTTVGMPIFQIKEFVMMDEIDIQYIVLS
jgi:hypothetical protein